MVWTFIGKRRVFTKLSSLENRIVTRGTYADIYDGAVWKESNQAGRFLTHPNDLSLMMNVDWCNPYEETQYSVGAIRCKTYHCMKGLN